MFADWLAAHPWILPLSLIALAGVVTWAIQKRRTVDTAEPQAPHAADPAAVVAAGLAQTPRAPAGVPTVIETLAVKPGESLASGSGAVAGPSPAAATHAPVVRRPAAAPPPEADTKELPPLEWTPGLIATKPALARPQSATRPVPAAAAAAAPPAAPRAPAPAAAPRTPAPPPAIPGFDVVEPETRPAAAALVPGFDIIEPTAAAAPAASQPAVSKPPAAPTIPGFDLVEARPAPAIPGFETVQPNPFIKPLQSFDSGVRTRPDGLFDTVPERDEAAPRFDLLPMDESETEIRQLDLQGALSTPTPTPTPPPPAAEPAPAAPAPSPVAPVAKNVRIPLGSKGEYQLAKLVRQHPDGRQDVLCFELLRGGQSLRRGTQEEVKEALRQALGGQG